MQQQQLQIKKGVIRIGGISYQAKDLSRVKLIARELSHPIKLKILQQIAEREDGVCVNDLCVAQKMTQPHISVLLMQLKKEKIVDVRKDGRRRLYTINKSVLQVASEVCQIASRI